MLVTSDADCIPTNERQSQALLGDWLELAGVPAEAFPLDTDGAAAVLQAGGYAIDTGELLRLGELGQVPRIGSWDGRDLLAAASALEARRQWQLAPCPHDFKKHESRRLLESFLADGERGLREFKKHFAKFDVRFALILLVEADNREVRERLFSTVSGLLALEGVNL